MEKQGKIKISATESAYFSLLLSIAYLILYSMAGYQVISLIVLGISFLGYFITLEKIKRKQDHNLKIPVAIFVVILFGVSLYLLCNLEEILNAMDYWFLVSCCMMILFNLFCILRYRRILIRQIKNIHIEKVFKNNGIILAIVFVLSLIYFWQNSNVQPRWDNSILYRILVNENATVLFDVNKLCITTYLRSAFCIYNAFWEGMVHDPLLGMHIGQYFVFVIGILYFYKILVYLFPQKNRGIIAILTLIYAVNPFVLGASSNANWDYYSMHLFLPVFYYWRQNERCCHIFWSVLFLFTKEVNIILYFGLILGSFVLKIKQNSLQSVLVERKYFDALRLMLSVAFVGIMGLLRESGLLIPFISLWLMVIAITFLMERGRDRLIRFFSKKKNCILFVAASLLMVILGMGFAISRFNNGMVGWNVNFILQKLKVLFVLNFNWIISLFAIGGIVVSLKKTAYKNTVISLLCADGCFIIFSCFFMTYNHPRYIDAHLPILCLLASIVLLRYAKEMVGAVVSIVLACVLGIQNYRTIDPFSLGLFNQLEYGKNIIITTSDTEPISDSAVYNYEWTWFDQTLNVALEGVVAEQRLFIFPKHSFYFEGNNMVSGEQYWDQKRKLRLLYENHNTIPIRVQVPKGEDTLHDLSKGEYCYYFYTDYYGTEYYNQLVEDKAIVEEKEFNKGGCKMYRVLFVYNTIEENENEGK